MSEDMENGGRSDSAGILAMKPNPGLKFEKKLSETERSTRDIKLINVGKKKKDVKFVLTPTKKRLLSRSISASSSTDSFDSSK
ncbi:Hypothetical predicted protein [Mytilus galloprovincialis]|uniref:Uncharacterized protein n=1 Tax=Mytilus galloprovincialis TaxID=29158 RepID=A0A8B6GSD3_MYTGA|nr:Hypothetical predicted protein [Mytilus galloprovincialis]